MFPPARKREFAKNYVRLTPKQAAQSMFDSFQCRCPDMGMDAAVKNTLAKVKDVTPERLNEISKTTLNGLGCRAGRSGFWINWQGELLPCGMFDKPKISLLEHSFEECWKYIVEETAKLTRCWECESCSKKEICKTCAAACLTETGHMDGKPEYLCQMTEACYQMLLDHEKK